MPDETIILKFRHLLEKHDLTAKLFYTIGGYLEEKGLLLREGTIVDATLIAAPSPTKNHDRKRDPEMMSVALLNYPDQEGQPVVFRHESTRAPIRKLISDN